MKIGNFVEIIEILLIELYECGELSEKDLRDLLSPYKAAFIDPDKTAGHQSEDGKIMQEIICEIVMPQTHSEYLTDPVWIDSDGPHNWLNWKKAQELFDYCWFCELEMTYCSNAAEDRMGITP